MGTQNKKRGLEFTIYDVVVDRKFLKGLLVTVYTVFASFLTGILAFEEINQSTSGANSTGQCCPCV